MFEWYERVPASARAAGGKTKLVLVARGRVKVGKAGLQGWRAKVADAVAEPVARNSSLTDEQVRAVVGGLFFALSVVYVAGTVKRMASGR